MSFNENILLSIKREYSGDEKFRYLLRHLDNVENEVRNKDKKITELLKAKLERDVIFEKLQKQIEDLKFTLSEYTAEKGDPKFVSIKSHDKLIKKAKDWENKFFERHWEIKDLKEKLESYERPRAGDDL